MAVTTKWYGVPVKNLMSGVANGVWDWDTDTIKLSLHTSSYAQNLDTDDFYNDVTNEVAANGTYTTGGLTLSGCTATYDGATDETRLDANDFSVTGVTFTTRYGVVYKSTGTASTSPLIALIDFGADQTVSSGNFSIQFASNGVIVADST